MCLFGEVIGYLIKFAIPNFILVLEWVSCMILNFWLWRYLLTMQNYLNTVTKFLNPKFLYSPRIAVLHNLFCMVFEQNSAILDMKKPLGKDMAWEIPLWNWHLCDCNVRQAPSPRQQIADTPSSHCNLWTATRILVWATKSRCRGLHERLSDTPHTQ